MQKKKGIDGKNPVRVLSPLEYKDLAEFRYQIRCYLRYMEEKARAAGYNPQQYQLLLAIEGLPEGQMPTIKTIAERMQLNHNSTVELVDRCERSGLLNRERNGLDRRIVSLVPTLKGKRMMQEQASASRAELQEIGPVLLSSLQRLTSQRNTLRSKVREHGKGKTIGPRYRIRRPSSLPAPSKLSH